MGGFGVVRLSTRAQTDGRRRTPQVTFSGPFRQASALRGIAAIVPIVMPWLLDRRNGEEYDLAPPTGEPRTFVVASVPRSGSTLLCRVLWDTGGVGAPKEYLNPMQLRDWEVRFGPPLSRVAHQLLFGRAAGLARGQRWTRERLAAHVARVRERRSDPSGRFGLKMHYHHYESWFPSRGWDVDALLAPTQWVRIVRRDRVAQAVSWARALQTGRWVARQRATLPPVYREGQIDRLVTEIDRQEAAWDAFFASRSDDPPLVVTYEDLASDMPATIRRVLAFLGVSDAENARVAEPDLQPVSDETNARWIERYRASHPERGLASGLE